jgi:DNA-binding NarL/FixJ family response regulator
VYGDQPKAAAVAARVVLADDHPLFLQALTSAVEAAGLIVAATATRGDELIDVMGSVQADAILLDLQMPGYDGFDCIERLRASHPDVRLIVVSATDDEVNIRRALASGAICFIGKSIDPNDLAAAVRALLSEAIHLDNGANGNGNAHDAVLPSETVDDALPSETVDDAAALLLTRRELEVLRLASSGFSNGQVAKTLWVTEQTVKFHLSNIYRKVGAQNRTEASRWAQKNGLLDTS